MTKEKSKMTLKEECVDFLKFAFIFGICFFGARSLVFDYFIVPSSSMFPNLLVGDMPLVEKWPYGYSKHSFWFSPNVFDGRVLKQRDVKRGEVIVFKGSGKYSDINLIKRVIGLPGDTIQVVNGDIIVNGKLATRKYIKDVIYVDENDHSYKVLKLYEEVLPESDIVHTVAYDDEFTNSVQNNTEVFDVPEGCYFVMGDNRDYSKDSRCGLGLVPEENLMGHAIRIIHSIANSVKLWEPHLWLQNIRYSRILQRII